MPAQDRPASAPIRAFLSAAWRENHDEYVDGETLHGTTLISAFDDMPPDITDCDVSLLNWIALFDELAAYHSVLYMHYMEALQGKEAADVRRRDQVSVGLAGGSATNLMAMRNLIISGYDVNAKQLLRMYGEYLDVWQLVLESDEIATEFFETQDLVLANTFWHRHLSRNKAIKRILARFYSRAHLDELQRREFDDWLLEEAKVLSAASHPSFIGGFMSIAQGSWSADRRAGLGFVGRPDLTSIRTIRNALFRAVVFLLEFNQALDSELGTAAGHVQKYIRVSHKALLPIFASTLDDRPAEFFKFPEETVDAGTEVDPLNTIS